ncbi:MAG TPA: hypothetical protein ENJ18_15105 [Nannocystis exedens]|nr:hypothetical protein [Nannocystis exedens]
MNTSIFRLSLAVVAIAPVLAIGCVGDSGDDAGDSGEAWGAEIRGAIEEDTVWSEDTILGGVVTVKNGAVLTVEPGVVVRGKTGSALVIAKGSRLEAIGSAEEPIVFTSSQAEGSRARGDWGGIVLLGDAATNLVGGIGIAEGLEDQPNYGGGENPKLDGSCGSLSYVRIEFAGYELTTDNELNGLTLYACGSGTVVDYVQVHMGEDDGIEMFGGSWSGSHIVVSGAGDDSIDIDQGWNGQLQHVVIVQDPGTGNFAFEISNQEANRDAEPRTAPRIANVTALGGSGSKSGGIKLKEGAAGEFYNVIVSGFNNAAVELTEVQTEAQAEAGAIIFQGSLFFDNARGGGEVYVTSKDSSWDLSGFMAAGANNLFDLDPMLVDTDWQSLDVAPKPTSPVLEGVSVPADFTEADYIGAVRASESDWTQGWTSFVPS